MAGRNSKKTPPSESAIPITIHFTIVRVRLRFVILYNRKTIVMGRARRVCFAFVRATPLKTWPDRRAFTRNVTANVRGRRVTGTVGAGRPHRPVAYAYRGPVSIWTADRFHLASARRKVVVFRRVPGRLFASRVRGCPTVRPRPGVPSVRHNRPETNNNNRKKKYIYIY